MKCSWRFLRACCVPCLSVSTFPSNVLPPLPTLTSPSTPPPSCVLDRYRIKTGPDMPLIPNKNQPNRPTNETSDILLDDEDRNLASRGAILDKEGQALLLRLRALGPLAGGSAASATDAAAAATAAAPPRQRSSNLIAPDNTHSNNGDLSDAGGGWEALESSLRHAISLRYVSKGGRGRSRYAEELSDALRELEEARCVNLPCFL